MQSHLYRFRPADALLDKYHELERQEIYFASPEELNDPMEGFVDILWRGDRIVWENLLRHYLVCLQQAYMLASLSGPEAAVPWEYIPIVDPGDRRAHTPAHRQLHEEMFDMFFAEPAVEDFINAIVNRDGPIRRDELIFHLTGIHRLALFVIRQTSSAHGMTPKLDSPETLRDAAIQLLRNATSATVALKQSTGTEPLTEQAIEDLFTVSVLMFRQQALRNIQQSIIDPTKVGANLVVHEFPEGYVKQIERILYPDWYVACFMENCSKSSIWGTYGSKHEGICLRFKTTVKDGRHSLRLNFFNGVSANGPIRSDAEAGFDKVTYTPDVGSVDFFSSIGRLFIPVLNKYWYADKNGQRSSSAALLDRDQKAWREAYWQNFRARTTSKLEDWQLECEHRIVHCSSLLDLSNREMRKATYRLEDLDGIIFGIRTPLEDKLKIIQVIQAKWAAHGKTDLKFYQAAYSKSKGVIEHHELGLLKL
ncbi:MAG TPA: hypothetical protein VGM81_14335 [Burkholderiaceae bacterium]